MSDYLEGPKGVGGWLGFFLVVIGIISPIRVVIELASLYGDPEIASAYGESWSSVLVLGWVTSAVELAICWFVAWRLLTVHNRQSIRITIAAIWIVSVGTLLLSLLLISMFAQIPVGDMMAAGGALEIVRSLVFAIIWTSYFMVSKRVANTYRDHTGEEAAAVFS